MSTAINFGAIEKELSSLWKQAGEDGESGVIRSCQLNLLIYSPASGDVRLVDDIITEVSAERPVRAILMIADRDSQTAALEANVTSHCTIPDGMSKQVCCEQITITASGERVNEMRSAVVPLLVPDLPVYLWWNAVPQLTDKVFRYLGDVSDRVIIDSEDFADQHGDVIQLASIIRDNGAWTAFTDLNWARLTAWRGLLAGFYDVAAYRPLLNQLSRMTIEYAPRHGADELPARAMILAGWLTSRLKWKLQADGVRREGGKTTFQMNADGRDVIIEFVVTANAEVKPGYIVSVMIASASDAACTVVVSRSADGKRIETNVSLGETRQVQRVLSYDYWTDAALIGRELEILGHDRVYEQAITAAGKLVAALG